MSLSSHVIATLDQGLILEITEGDYLFTAYVAIRSDDIDNVAQLISAKDYEEYNNIHVAAINSQAEAAENIEDICFNVEPGDAVVFLCTTQEAYLAVLHELGQPEILS